MYRGIVAGTVVATVKESHLEGVPLLVVRKIENGVEKGLIVAADHTRQAGYGDEVDYPDRPPKRPPGSSGRICCQPMPPLSDLSTPITKKSKEGGAAGALGTCGGERRLHRQGSVLDRLIS